MIDKENRIPFDLRSFQSKKNSSFEIQNFSFTEAEKRYVPNFNSLDKAKIHVSVINAGDMFTLTFDVYGECSLIDAHDSSIIPYILDDSVDVIIAPNSEEENDIFPDEDGIYDLRGSVLALLYDAIPKNYSLVELTKIEKDNYVVMSEDEYKKEHQKNKNAFASLDEMLED